MSRFKIIRILSVALTALLMQISVSAQIFKPVPRGESVVCHRESISGFEEIGERSHRFLGQTTDRVDQIKLYISFARDAWFVGSNFNSSGEGYPTKIVANIDFDVAVIIQNIVSYGRQTLPYDRFDQIIASTEVTLSDNFLRSRFYSPDDFTSFKRVATESEIIQREAEAKARLEENAQLKNVKSLISTASSNHCN